MNIQIINYRCENLNYPEDCKRIQEAITDNTGKVISLRDCELMWEDYSSKYAAGWLFLPTCKDELWGILRDEFNMVYS